MILGELLAFNILIFKIKLPWLNLSLVDAVFV